MRLLNNKLLFYSFVCFIGVAVSFWLYYLAPHRGSFHTNYNVFLVFRQSGVHLLMHLDLYQHYPEEYNDLYKYTPSFAFFMIPFGYLPDFLGIALWNVINVSLLYYALYRFPFANDKKKLLAMLFILIEVLTSLIQTQSNCLIAGLFLITFLCLEKKQILPATLSTVLAVFIKPFALLLFMLYLFYPSKLKVTAYSALWFVVILALPLLVVSPEALIANYKSWFLMLKNDHDASYGLSLLGLANAWFGITAKNALVLAGLLILSIPLFRYKAYNNVTYRILILASLLIWVILFNHKAETPGFVIAISGAALWYFTKQHNSKFNTFLLLLALLFTVLEPTDIFPESFRGKVLVPYVICVIPVFLIWVKIIWELLTGKFLSPSSPTYP